MKNKDYWFALKSYVYVEFKERKILLYDTKSGNYIETENKDAISLISQLYEPKNLGVTTLTKDMQLEPNINQFVNEVLEKQIGDLTDIEKLPNKPIRLIPILNLQKDVDKLKKNEENYHLIGDNAKNYLMELNIFLNNNCSLKCSHCKKYFKQMYCCTTHNPNGEIILEDIENIFFQIQYSSIGKVNILGGNIFSHKDISRMYNIFDSFKDILHCYFHYKNYKPNLLPESIKLELIVNFPLKKVDFKNIWNLIDREKTNVRFIIENEDQFFQMESIINEYKIMKYKIHPVYTGENLTFFQENIFISKENIFSKTLSIREIFRNQKLNSNFFGSLYILPDGSVKANMNVQSIGNIKTNSLLSFIFKEMFDNTAWRIVRNSTPCNECLYQFICPAPSNYEIAIGRSNLCHVLPNMTSDN